MANFHYQGRIWVLDNYKPYRKEVVRYLDSIRKTYTGDLLVKKINEAKSWLLILPFKPTPKDPVNAYQNDESSVKAHERGQPFIWTRVDINFGFGHGTVPIPAFGTGDGSNSYVWFHPANQRQVVKNLGGQVPPGEGPGETLLHELIHAMRGMHGKFVVADVKSNPHMDGFEEFCAILVANIYRSERGFKLMRADHRGSWAGPLSKVDANSANYYDTYKDEIQRWFRQQKSFCLDLAKSSATFNPMKVAAVEMGLMPATSMRL